jgi:hypothetical protein
MDRRAVNKRRARKNRSPATSDRERVDYGVTLLGKTT